MRWFGPEAFNTFCENNPRAPIPTGQPCLWCDEPITPIDDGYLFHTLIERIPAQAPMHHICYVRAIVGGVNHQAGICACYGGIEPADPDNLSTRQAAQLAYDFFAHRQSWRPNTTH
jgi:hypothetical protein